MKKYNNFNPPAGGPISGESFFEPIPIKSFPLDKTHVSLDTSIIWHFNYLFWKHFTLWEKTYKEHYEASLPSGVSESHKDIFIEKSVNKFLRLLLQLEKTKHLPKNIIVLEQGPGTGLYAKKFLDLLQNYSKKNNKSFYKQTQYVITDTSKEILATAQKTLTHHKKHIEILLLDATANKKTPFDGNVLFARHSNLWDQFPARMLVFSPRHSRATDNDPSTLWKSGKPYKDSIQVSEILVKAVVDKSFLNFAAETIPVASPPLPTLSSRRGTDFFSLRERIKERGKTRRNNQASSLNVITQLQSKQIEQFITTYPLLWKPLMRSIKFKTKIKKLTKKEIHNFPYSTVIQRLTRIAVGKQEIIISNAVLENITQLISLIDWQRNGYCEVVDIIVPDMSGYQKDRRPKKYDGSIATVVNGPLMKAFLQAKHIHARFDKIRGINSTVTMRNHNVQTLIDAKDFITIGEIAARRDEKIDQLKQDAEGLFTLGIDVVGFSDQAFVKPNYLSQKEIIDSTIFKNLPGEALMPILKTRNKTWEEIQSLTNKLKQQHVKNLFIVTGDPGLEKEVLHTSIEITQKLKDDFFIGGVVNADVDNIPKTKGKIQAGTNFFIMQATYDQEKFNRWVEEIKKKKFHEQAPIIAAIVPIVSQRTLSILQFINDMQVTDTLNKKFANMDNKTLRKEGITLAKEMVEEYKQTGIFSGIYIYSKSHEVICEVMGFPYQKKGNVNDSL